MKNPIAVCFPATGSGQTAGTAQRWEDQDRFRLWLVWRIRERWLIQVACPRLVSGDEPNPVSVSERSIPLNIAERAGPFRAK
jgi:hypothetical protein